MSEFKEFENPWAVGGEYHPTWISDDEVFWDDQADFITGKRRNAPIREKNPMTDEWITDEELQVFKEIFGRIPQGNPYDWLIRVFKELKDIQFPSLPADARLQADWDKMFNVWFFETNPNLDDFNWVSTSKTIFEEDSKYSVDIVNSISFIDSVNPNCIRKQFFLFGDDKRPNPLKASFKFTGSDSGRENYYSLVEWFLGSFETLVYWEKRDNGSYDIFSKINNTSSWYSGTRLPKSWQQKIKNIAGVEIKNLVNSAPRGETIRRKLSPFVVSTLEFLGVNIPSFGGNWEQEFYVKTNWSS